MRSPIEAKATTTMGQAQGIMIYFSRSSIHHNGDHHPEAHEKPIQPSKPLQPVLSSYGDDDHQRYKHDQLEWHEPPSGNHGDSFTFDPRSASHYLPSPSCPQHDCVHWTTFHIGRFHLPPVVTRSSLFMESVISLPRLLDLIIDDGCSHQSSSRSQSGHRESNPDRLAPNQARCHYATSR